MRAVSAALAVLVVLLAPGPAAAAAKTPGQFSISPARRSIAGRPPLALTSTTVGNSTSEDYRVDVFPVLLHQTVAGPFDFTELPGPLQAARNVLTAGPSHFVLRAHTARKVHLRWELMPRGRDNIVVGIVFQGTPPAPPGATVKTITRLLSINFLRSPNARPARGRLVSVGVRPDVTRPRHLQVVARVRNVGRSVARPCDPLVRVRDAHGRVVRVTHWRGDVVAPGAARDFLVALPGTLAAGRYRVAVGMCFGRTRRLRGYATFTLVGRGVLPSPALTLRRFNAGGQPGKDAHARGTFVSTGTAPASSRVVVRLYRRRGPVRVGAPLKTVRLHVGPLKPGAHAPLDVNLGSLAAGEYRATATYSVAPGTRQTAESDFTPLKMRSDLSRAWGWVKDHAGWLVAAVLALLLLLTRRRRREDDEQPPAQDPSLR